MELKHNNLTLITDIKNHVDKTVQISGWIHNLRSSGKIHFLEVRDGSGFVQAVAVNKEISETAKEQIAALTQESSVLVEGVVSKHPKKENVFELQVRNLEILQKADEYPITKKEHGTDFLLEHRHLWLRSKKQWAIQRIRNTVINSIYEFLNNENFIKIDSPIITSNACEGTTTLFGFDYFDLGKGYLSQSGQLYLEAAIAAHRRVFDFGPVFRAEKSKTRKHLTEFWMMDAEMAFFSLEDSMNLQENMIKYIMEQALTRNLEDLKIMERDTKQIENIINSKFHRLSHKEVVKVLQSMGSEITEEIDLGANDEELLSQKYNEPVFIHTWPAKIKAFYMKRCKDDPKYVQGSDLMANEGFGEIIGGSQREDDCELLIQRMKDENLNIEDFKWYLDLRKYGSVPHGGFGLGLERTVAWVSGTKHIRETIPFPRMINRYHP